MRYTLPIAAVLLILCYLIRRHNRRRWELVTLNKAPDSLLQRISNGNQI